MATAAELEYLRRQAASANANKSQNLDPMSQGSEAATGNVDANAFERTWGTLSSISSGVQYGVNKAFEGIIDFGANVIGGLFGGGWFGAENDLTRAMTDFQKKDLAGDWQQLANQYGLGGVDQFLYYHSKNGWGADSFDWNNYDSNKTLEAQTWGKELGEDTFNTIKGFEQAAGQMVPQIALSVATAGASAGMSTAGQLGMQALTGAVNSASTFGTSAERALNEGASYQEASGFAGATSLFNFVLETGLGMAGLNAMGDKTAKAVGSKVAEKFGMKAGVAAKILVNSVGEGFEEVIEDSVEPLFQQWTYNQNALEEAYGAENIGNTLGDRAKTFAIAMILAGAIESIPKVDLEIKSKKDGVDYVSYSEEVEAYSDACEEVQKLTDKQEKLIERAKKAETEEKRDRLMERAKALNDDISKAVDTANDFIENKGIETKIEALNNAGAVKAETGDTEIDEKILSIDKNLIKRMNNIDGNKVTNGEDWSFITKSAMERVATSLQKEGMDVKIVSPMSVDEISDTAFATANLNGKAPTAEFMEKAFFDSEFEVKSTDEMTGETKVTKGKLGDLLGEEETARLSRTISEYIDALYENSRYNDISEEKLSASHERLAKAREELGNEIKALKDRIRTLTIEKGEVARFVKNANSVKRTFRGESMEYKPTSDTILQNQGKALLSPFASISVDNKNGNVDATEFASSMAKFNELYTEERFSTAALKFNPMLKAEIEDVIELLSDGAKKLNADQMQAVNTLFRDAKAEYAKALKKASKDKTATIAANKQRELFSISKSDRGTKIGQAKTKAESAFYYIDSPNTALKNHVFGPGLASDCVDEIVFGVGSRNAYVSKQTDAIHRKRLELGFDNKKIDSYVEIKGKEVPFSSAVTWLANAEMSEDTNNAVYAGNGLAFTNKADKVDTVKLEEGDNLIAILEEALGSDLEKAREYISFIKGEILGSDETYGMVKEVTGSVESNPDAGLSPQGEYLFTRPYNENAEESLNKGKMIGSFSNKHVIKRKSASTYMLDGRQDVFTHVNSWLEDMGTSYYVMPKIYDLQVVAQDVIKDLNGTDRQVLDNFIGQANGTKRQSSSGVIGNGVTLYRVSNPLTWLKQPASYFAAGIDGSAMAKYSAIAIKNAVKADADHAGAWDAVCKAYPELSVRGNENVVLTGNGFTREVGKATHILSKGNAITDKATIKSIVFVTLHQYKAELGASSISDANVINAAMYDIRSRIETQISSNQAMKSPLQMGGTLRDVEHKNMMSLVMRPFGGAATGYVRNLDNNISDIRFFGKLKVDDLKSDLETARAKSDADTAKFDANGENVKAIEQAITDLEIEHETEINRLEGEKVDKLSELAKKRAEARKAFDSDSENAEKNSAYQEAKHAETVAREELNQEISKANDEFSLQKAKLSGDLKEAKADLAASEVQSIESKASVKSIESILSKKVRFDKRGGAKGVAVSFASQALLMGLLITALTEVDKRVKGKKKWDEWDIQDILLDTALNSSVNNIPVLRTLSSYLKSGYDPADPTASFIQSGFELISSAKDMLSGGDYKKFMREAIEMAGMASGFPTKSVYDYVYGITKTFSPDAALSMRSVFYNITSESVSSYNDAVADGDDKTALAYLSRISSERMGEMSVEVQSELLRLSKEGESVLPQSVATSYTDANGNEVTVSWTDQQKAKRSYSKANAQLAKLIKSSAYAKLSNEAKAKAVKAISSAYRTNANASVNASSSTKLSLMARTSNPFEVICALSYIRSLEGDSKKAKALAYVNSLSLSRNDKMLILSLAGYKVDESMVKSALLARGMAQEDVKTFLA